MWSTMTYIVTEIFMSSQSSEKQFKNQYVYDIENL